MARSLPRPDPRRLIGALGEGLARRHLEARGFELLDVNFRTRHGELDVVAADSRCLVFCEVKTRVVALPGPARASAEMEPHGERPPEARFDELGPFAAIDARKQRRVRLMAREWLAQHGRDLPWRAELRFDAIGIELDPAGRLVRLEHLEGAF